MVISKDGAGQIFYLVFPTEENIKEGSISVMSTLGVNLVGLAVDNTIQIEIPSDFRSLKIAKVEQSHQLLSGSYFGMIF